MKIATRDIFGIHHITAITSDAQRKPRFLY
jgi:hypothetical protein